MPPDDWIEHRAPATASAWGGSAPRATGSSPTTPSGASSRARSTGSPPRRRSTSAGLHWLADLWQLELPDGTIERVRMVEVTPTRVVVKVDDFGAVEAVTASYVLPFPAPDTLRPFEGDATTIDGGLSRG